MRTALTLRTDLWRVCRRFFFRMRDDDLVLASRRVQQDPTPETAKAWCADVRRLCYAALDRANRPARNAARRLPRMSDDQLLTRLAQEPME